MDGPTRTVVFVEGVSDQRAVQALARRRGRDLVAERIGVVPIGGAQAISVYLDRFGTHGSGARLAGLCDAGEERHFRQGLERVGLGSKLTRTDMESLGFFVCVEDLEDEFVRALGSARVEAIIAAQGETGSFRTFQKQPDKRALTLDRQLHGFMWNRKIRYAPLLVAALELNRVPRPLDGLLEYV